MSIKKSLLATALAALAFAALPAVASAIPHVDYPGAGNFTSIGEEAKFNAGAASTICKTSTSEGKFETKTTGWVTFTFHSCKSFGVHCQSGANTGTITTTKLTFHLVTVTKPSEENKVTPAILVTPNHVTGTFAHYSCPALGVTTTVAGEGIIGKILLPGYNQLSQQATIDFNVVAGQQEYRTVHGEAEETEWGQSATVNGGAAVAASMDAEGILTFTEGEGQLTE